MASSVPRRVALFLAGVQFFFALTWVVYVIYLPQLAAQVGLPKTVVIWLLMLDQLIFVVVDFAMGVAADRAARHVRSIGPAILAVTLVSCAAFVLLPVVAPQGSVGLFVAVTVLWSVTSSVLRAPPLTLVGRHAAKPLQPGLIAWSMLGLGVAAACAPYLGKLLAGIDPRVPFVVSSAALAFATLGIVAAERALLRSEAVAKAVVAPVEAAPRVPGPGFIGAALLVALAFQVHVFLNSGPLYLRQATQQDLPMLLPVFWIGFNLAMWPAGQAAKRFGALSVMAVCGVLAALAALLAQHMPNLSALVAVQLVAGAAWGGLLVSAFASALVLGQPGREGWFSGALSSVLALATLARMGTLAAGWAHTPQAAPLLGWAPVLGWLSGALLLVALWQLRPARR